jgi:hypothetical protein
LPHGVRACDHTFLSLHGILRSDPLLGAACDNDGAAALAVSQGSLDDATQRIRGLLAAQKKGDNAP